MTSVALTVAATASGTFAVGTVALGVPAASARVICAPGEHYRVTQRQAVFQSVKQVTVVNKKAQKATLDVTVGSSHTSTRQFGATLEASVEGGFWVFAKASAKATGNVTITTSTTMNASYGLHITVPGHSTRTIRFGFGRYNQYIQRYHEVNTSPSACGLKVDAQGWVRAPYGETFKIS